MNDQIPSVSINTRLEEKATTTTPTTTTAAAAAVAAAAAAAAAGAGAITNQIIISKIMASLSIVSLTID